MKDEEKFNRTRYLRNLEKFFNQAKSALKREDFDLELFKQRMAKNAKNFDKTPAVILNSNYSKELENFVNSCLNSQIQRQDLLNKANAIDKLKKTQSYKKEKHKERIFTHAECDF